MEGIHSSFVPAGTGIRRSFGSHALPATLLSSSVVSPSSWAESGGKASDDVTLLSKEAFSSSSALFCDALITQCFPSLGHFSPLLSYPSQNHLYCDYSFFFLSAYSFFFFLLECVLRRNPHHHRKWETESFCHK